jgi:hypothetical protein
MLSMHRAQLCAIARRRRDPKARSRGAAASILWNGAITTWIK